MPSPNEETVLLAPGIALSQVANITGGVEDVQYADSIARAESATPQPDDQVVLVREGLAQGQPGISGGFIDDFEHGDIDLYNLPTDQAEITTEAPVFEGQYSLKLIPKSGTDDDGQAVSTDEAINYPEVGDIFNNHVWLPSPQNDTSEYRKVFFVQEESYNPNGYHVVLDRNGYFRIEKNRRGTTLAEEYVGFPEKTWIEIRTRTSYDSTADELSIDSKIINTDTGETLSDLSGTDSSNPYTDGGIAWVSDSDGPDVAVDLARFLASY